jgi:hypothetical protein
MLRDVSRSTWEFSRSDGFVITPALRLQVGGKVTNHRYVNETYWSLEDGRLCFLDGQRRVTTVFTDTATLEDGRRLLRGAFVPSRGEIVHVLTERLLGRAELASPPPRVAVLVRTHVANTKVTDLLSILSESACFDLFICADCTKQELQYEGVQVLRHRRSDAAAANLPTQIPNLMWYCGDYALYFSFAQIPDYDYYMMIEYDVHIPDRSPLVMEGIINRLGFGTRTALDFIGCRCHEGSLEQGWGHTVAGVYPQAHLCQFPFVVLSRAAVEYLRAERQAEGARTTSAERLMFCEAFVPSALRAGGFRCADLNSILPKAVDAETFRVAADQGPMLLTQKILAPTTRLLHPVYDEDNFISYFVNQARRTRDPRVLAALSRNEGDLPLSAQARQTIEDALAELA